MKKGFLWILFFLLPSLVSAIDITACTNLTQNNTTYILKNNLNFTSATCIYSNSSNIIFNGMGYTINGTDSSYSAIETVGAVYYSNVTFMNFSVNRTYGVFIAATTYNVSNLTFYNNNKDGLDLYGGTGSANNLYFYNNTRALIVQESTYTNISNVFIYNHTGRPAVEVSSPSSYLNVSNVTISNCTTIYGCFYSSCINCSYYNLNFLSSVNKSFVYSNLLRPSVIANSSFFNSSLYDVYRDGDCISDSSFLVNSVYDSSKINICVYSSFSEEFKEVLGGGGSLTELLESYNPEMYPIFISDLKKLFYDTDLNNFLANLKDFIVSFFKYVLRQPATMVKEESV